MTPASGPQNRPLEEVLLICHVCPVKGDYELAVLAASQAGYFGHDQAEAAGLSKTAIQYRLDSGLWVPVRKGLYKVDGLDGDHKGLLRGAMAILPDPTISHESAAEVHAIPYIPRRRAVVTVHARTTHNFPGVQVHRSRDMAADHRQLIESLWTTTPARTLNDVAAVIHPQAMALALDDSLARRHVSVDEVTYVFNQVARRGRIGSGIMRKLLEERVGEQLITGSRLERVGFSVFKRGGLPQPVWQYPAPWDPDKRIDFAWPHVRVGCECDSRRWHTRVADFENDRHRDNLSLIHNWRIFRFTWDDFTKRPQLVIAQLSDAIAA